MGPASPCSIAFLFITLLHMPTLPLGPAPRLQEPAPLVVAPMEFLVDSAAVSPDGRFLCYCDRGQHEIIVWDWRRKLVAKRLPACEGGTHAVAFSPDGKLLAACSSSKKDVKIWEAGSWKQFPGIDDVGMSLAFSADSKQIVLAGARHCRVWELGKKTPRLEIEVRAWNDRTEASVVAASRDGRLIAVGTMKTHLGGSPDVAVIVYSMDTGKELFRNFRHKGVVSQIVFSSTGQYVLSGDWDDGVAIYSTSDGKEVMFTKANLSREMNTLTFGPKEETVFVDSRGLVVIDIRSKRELGRFARSETIDHLHVLENRNELVAVQHNDTSVNATIWDLNLIMRHVRGKAETK